MRFGPGLSRRTQPELPGRCRRGRSLAWSCALAWLIGCGGIGWGQEAVRTSLAGEQAAEAQRRASAIPADYNIKLGPTYWWFTGRIGIEYRDNVDYTAGGTEGDVIILPGVDTAMRWPITERNTLHLGVGFSYAAYLDRTDLNRLSVRPGSLLAYDIYAGDWRFTLYDRFQITQETYENPTVSGRGNYSRLENTTGAIALWDLHELIVSLGYHHSEFIGLSGGSQFPDGASDAFLARAAFLVSPTVMAGVESGGSLVRYRHDAFQDGHEMSAGVFAQGDVTQHVHAQARAGWVRTSFTRDQDYLYADLTIRHDVNERFKYSLSGGREVRAGLYYARAAESVEADYARFQAEWSFLQKVTMILPLFYQRTRETGTLRDERSDQFGGGVRMARQVGQKTWLGLQYQYVQRDSDLPNRDYQLNIVQLHLAHRF
jgi:hypothetical protein